MARGISEQDVFDAADKLLARGERPTIERVRNELGRGSPNTVNRLLDGWWAGLSARLASKEATKLPPSFQAACERLYERVVADSMALAERQVAARLAESGVREAELTAREQALLSQAATLSVPVEMLRADLAKATEKIVTLNSEKAVCLRELEAMKANEIKLSRQLEAAASDLDRQAKAAQSEIARVKAQWEAQENRWLRQIDALREDLKLARSERAGDKRLAAQRVSSLEGTVARLQKSLAAAKRAPKVTAKSRRPAGRSPSKKG